uniref:radical SAM family heme chaperone HemW n=1 Tax=Ndongobacter massiliensis TaxID=1871025 RepID=UPI00093141A7|nr:radical SAM family heme chaperone HemW [Ndongobacter massiliensis]
MKPIGVYIHLPFCAQRCFYCDFLTFPHAESLHEPYLSHILQEITEDAVRRGLRGRHCDSVFFGGGTPSLFPPSAIRQLLEQLRSVLSLTADCEITLEGNPATLNEKKAAAYRAAGVNRLSLGVQSFSDGLLRTCGRDHTAQCAKQDVRILQAAGFTNLSLDLIYGIPGQQPSDIEEDLRCIAELEPQHISWYALIVEPRTIFFEKEKQETLRFPNEEALDALERRARCGLAKLGYMRYEISNFAKEGYASRHNVKYWTAAPYWGLGLGAASYLDGVRSENVRTFSDYFARVDAGKPAWNVIPRTDEEDAFEFVMMGLRLVRGIDRHAFAKRYGYDLCERAAPIFEAHRKRGNLVWSETRVRLTEQGLAFQNTFLVDLLECFSS